MQWRRGLAFATVHLVVAFSIAAAIEANDFAMWRDHYSQLPPAQRPPIALTPSSNSASDSAPDFSICGMIDQTSPGERIIAIADFPATFFTAWRVPCPPRWTISGMLIGTAAWGYPTPTRQAKQRVVDGILLLLVTIQWLLIGSFPLRPDEKVTRDPATLITACAATAVIISFVPPIDFLTNLFVLVAGVTWLYWLAQLAWKLLHSATSLLSRERTAPS
jgi:hypothetical protein